MNPKQSALVLIALLFVAAIACSGSTLFGGGEEGADQTEVADEVPPATESEQRCGDAVCDGPETAETCPEDCAAAASEGEEPQPEESGGTGRAYLTLLWESSFGTGCNVDELHASMEFTLSVTDDGGLVGSGEGTLRANEISRCPDTDYGGLETPAPYPVTLTGSPVGDVWQVELTANDVSRAVYGGGGVYHEESVLSWILPQYEGEIGTLEYFALPQNVQAGDEFIFDLDYEVAGTGGGYTNHFVGTGWLTIIETPQ
jgi:hypothetical protein